MLKYIEWQEIQVLLTAARSKKNHLEAILALMALAGLRISEVLHLTLDDVFVAGSVSKVIAVQPRPPKHKKYREVPVSIQLAEILARHLSRRLATVTTSPLLFPGLAGPPFTSRNIQMSLQRLSRLTLGKPVNPHMLRHSFATILARSAPIRVVQELLGHRRLNTTQIYTHVNKSDLTSAIGAAFPPGRDRHTPEEAIS